MCAICVFPQISQRSALQPHEPIYRTTALAYNIHEHPSANRKTVAVCFVNWKSISFIHGFWAPRMGKLVAFPFCSLIVKSIADSLCDLSSLVNVFHSTNLWLEMKTLFQKQISIQKLVRDLLVILRHCTELTLCQHTNMVRWMAAWNEPFKCMLACAMHEVILRKKWMKAGFIRQSNRFDGRCLSTSQLRAPIFFFIHNQYWEIHLHINSLCFLLLRQMAILSSECNSPHGKCIKIAS